MRRRIRRFALGVAAILAIWAFWWEPRSLTAREVDLRLACWRTTPVRIAVIGDLHAGAPYIDEAKVNRVVDMVNAKHPDAVVLLGDYVVQGVLGGHFVPRVERALRANGIRVVDDEAVRIAGFWIVGISDLWTGRHDIAGAIAKVSDDAAGHVAEGGRDLFVTSGVGTSIIPVRFRVPPEVVFLRIER